MPTPLALTAPTCSRTKPDAYTGPMGAAAERVQAVGYRSPLLDLPGAVATDTALDKHRIDKHRIDKHCIDGHSTRRHHR